MCECTVSRSIWKRAARGWVGGKKIKLYTVNKRGSGAKLGFPGKPGVGGGVQDLSLNTPHDHAAANDMSAKPCPYLTLSTFVMSGHWNTMCSIFRHVFEMNEIIPTGRIPDNSGKHVLTGGLDVRDSQAGSNDISHG